MKKVLVGVVALALVVSGCTVKLNGSSGPTLAGVFKSGDKGETWAAKNTFLSAGGVGSIAGAGVVRIVPDPQDPKTFYLATTNAGLLYTYDSGNSWLQAGGLGGAAISDVSVDAKDKCVLYAAKANTVVKSQDCGRTWTEVLIDSKPATQNKSVKVTAVAVDSFNSLTIYAGDSQGDVFKSLDGGTTWQVVNRTKATITRILINPKDTRVVYTATSSKGIFKTVDSGASWADINTGLKKYSGALQYHVLLPDPTLADGLLLVAKYGLLKSDDGGNTWTALSLITPPSSTDILAAVISPASNQEIYYATRSTFYKTVDGGKNWVTKRLPSKAVPTYLITDPVNPATLYLGLQQPAK